VVNCTLGFIVLNAVLSIALKAMARRGVSDDVLGGADYWWGPWVALVWQICGSYTSFIAPTHDRPQVLETAVDIMWYCFSGAPAAVRGLVVGCSRSRLAPRS
jgi:hypothetical protein